MASSEGNKTARRISSLFSLGSSKDAAVPQSSQPSESHIRAASQVSIPIRSDDLSPRPHSASGDAGYPGVPVPRRKPVSNPIPPLMPPPPIPSHDFSTPQSPSRGGFNSRPGSRPNTPTIVEPPGGGLIGSPTSEAKAVKKKSWLLGRSSKDSAEGKDTVFAAWVAGLPDKVMYDVKPLVNGEKINELWDEQGNTFVYLFPKTAGKGPSMKFDSLMFGSSAILSSLAQGQNITSTSPSTRSMESRTPQTSLTVPDRSGTTSPSSEYPSEYLSDDASSSASRRLQDGFPEDQERDLHLYVPVPLTTDDPSLPFGPGRYPIEDMETLILFRNLFAFLLGQSLIATNRNRHLFDVFMRISVLLQRFEFSNFDGTAYGEVVTSSFNNYCQELNIADVRNSREKTIEAIVLGEKMKSWPLYNEGFVHGVGKWEDLKGFDSKKLSYISPVTRTRMERAHLDLEHRLLTVKGRLESFDFPSVFAGIANSTALPEAKQVRFQSWKKAFLAMRKHVMQHYKDRYGSWPPNARSKKNKFEEGGLNRLLLKEVYEDFCDLYELLVDRKSLTNRTADLPSQDDDADVDPEEPTPRALRRVMGEYDRSTPPVQPPIPFDTPLLPTLAILRRGIHHSGDPRIMAKERARRLKDTEINEILIDSYNRDAVKPSRFIEEFMRLERRSAHGKNIDEIMDHRNGQWLFLYAVIQSLPMLVVDAPDLRFTNGCEYFLCEMPRGSPPWCKEDAKQGRSWYGVAGGAGVVSLPSDVVKYSVEGIYRRSHCWELAMKWAEDQSQIMSSAIQESPNDPLPPPPGIYRGSPHVSPQLEPYGGGSGLDSPVGRSSQRNSSIALGLEALPIPAGVIPVGNEAGNLSGELGYGQQIQRPVSQHDPTKSFDDILKQVDQAKTKGKGKK